MGMNDDEREAPTQRDPTPLIELPPLYPPINQKLVESTIKASLLVHALSRAGIIPLRRKADMIERELHQELTGKEREVYNFRLASLRRLKA